MKKNIAILLSMILVLMMFAACSNNDDTGSNNKENEGITSEDKKGETAQDADDSGKPEVSSNFNATGLPVFNEPVTYKIMTPHPELAKKYFEEKDVYKKLSADTNVIIEWQELPSTGWEEKVNLAINAQDLPDALYVGGINANMKIQAIEADMLVPVSDYMAYAPNLQKAIDRYPVLQTASSYLGDNKMYSYPGLGVKDFAAHRAPLFINKQWLDNLGLEVPTTTEEYYQVLKAFKENDANGNGDKDDEIPVTFQKYWLGYDFQELFGAWGIQGVRNKGETTIRDGQLYFHPVEDAYRQALTYFHTLYIEGLMDGESLTQQGAAVNAKINSEIPIVGSYEGWGLPAVNAEQYIALTPLIGPNGDQFAIYNAAELDVLNGLMIFSNCEQPEGLIRWADTMNEEKRVLEMILGEEGIAWTADDEAKTWEVNYENLEELGVTLEDIKQTEGTQNGPHFQFAEVSGYTQVSDPESPLAQKTQWSEAARPYFFPENWPHKMPLEVLTERDEDINFIWSDLKQYLDIFLADAIITGLDDAKWDAHIKECEDLQYQEVVDYYQEKYDALEQ